MESEQTGIKQKNNGGPLPRSYSPRQSLRRRDGVRTKGNPLVLTSCRPPCGDGCMRPPVPKAKLLLEQAGSEQKCSARGTGGNSGVWKGASKGGNAPITGPFPPPGGHRREIEIEQTGIKTETFRCYPTFTGIRRLYLFLAFFPVFAVVRHAQHYFRPDSRQGAPYYTYPTAPLDFFRVFLHIF